MTDEYIPRQESDYRRNVPSSPRERSRLERIKKILRLYMVKGSEEDLEAVAIQIWREVKR